MSKYLPGAYLLLGFDAVGGRLWSRPTAGVLEGQAAGRKAEAAGECDSHAVVRVISNSKHQEPMRYDIRNKSEDHGFH